MLNTRFTTQGKRKKPPVRGRQIYALSLMVVLTMGFVFAGLRFMVTFETYAATPPSPSASPLSVSYAPTPLPSILQLSGQQADDVPQNALAAPQETPQPSQEPAPSGPIMVEDAENGFWKYETAAYTLEINRQQPLDGTVATVAVLSGDTGGVLQSAFAKDAYGKNLRQRTRDIAKNVGAIFAINGDYCGYRDNGLVIRNKALFINSPQRDMLAVFEDGHMEIIDELSADGEQLIASGVVHSFSFGPALVKDGLLPESFDTDVPGTNPRTAIGMKANGDLVFVVVDGRISGYSEGMTIEELAAYMLDLGCHVAYNLDGGMTSCMVFNDQVISTPCGAGQRERPLSDIIYLSR